jgi:hypothetical protein
LEKLRYSCKDAIINDAPYTKIVEDGKCIVDDFELLSSEPNDYIQIRDKIATLYNDVQKCYWETPNDARIKHFIEDLKEAINGLKKVLNNQWIELACKKTLLIVGEAGAGKSHLIGDIVFCRSRRSEPSILLLGQHFTDSIDPMSQILQLLDIRCKKESFLEQLHKYGEEHHETVVIFIDALNEGAGATLWQNFFLELATKIEQYDNLKLVVSFRRSQKKDWFYDLSINQQYAVYHHKGFEGNEQAACTYMFRSFNLEQPCWPIISEEFANPLFLMMYCRSHELSKEPLVMEDFWTTIKSFCESINCKLSQKYNYNEAQKLVFESLSAIALIMIQSKKRWFLEYKDALPQLTRVAQYTQNAAGFLDYLIDEGLLRTETYKGKTYIDFGFDRIGCYIIADCLIDNKSVDEWFLPAYGNLEEAMTVLVPIKRKQELFELTPKDNAIKWFINYAMWRDSFCIKGKELIAELKIKNNWHYLFYIIVQRPFRSEEDANAETLYELLWNLTMAERDKAWTILISDPYEQLGEKYIALARWGLNVTSASMARLDDKTIGLCAEALIWALSSTWRELRDTSTRALVNLLAERPFVLSLLLNKYAHINDPYIEERLWASAYGAVLCGQDKETAKLIALVAYNLVFDQEHVSEHILVRDYAKGIIRYAQSQGANLHQIDEDRLLHFPRSSELPQIPTSEEIKTKYELDYKDYQEDNKAVYTAQSNILNSMTTEHSSRGMYGDFGRYVFQAKIRIFPVDAEIMSNWAIYMIFEEYGYKASCFADFDSRYLNWDRTHDTAVERIGKKYQWIAMYRIMSRLMDLYPDIDYSKEWTTPVLNARNIDPTLRLIENSNKDRRSVYSIPPFDITKPEDDIKWIHSGGNMPSIESYLESQDVDGHTWINLFSYNTIEWKPTKISSTPIYNRDLWLFVQSFIVDKECCDKVCSLIHKYGLEGRNFHENSEIYNLYSRDFFWSDEYKFLFNIGEYGLQELSLGHKTYPDILMNPSYLHYTLSSSEDASHDDALNMLLPNQWLYEGLGLMYAKDNGAWVNSNGEIMVMDNQVYGNGHSALMVRKDALLSYLNKNNKCLIWPILIERMVRPTTYDAHSDYVQFGGWAYMDEKGVIHHKFRCYELTASKKWINKQKMKFNKVKESFLRWLFKHHLIRLSVKRQMGLYPPQFIVTLAEDKLNSNDSQVNS